jgi:hypothetical protein
MRRPGKTLTARAGGALLLATVTLGLAPAAPPAGAAGSAPAGVAGVDRAPGTVVLGGGSGIVFGHGTELTESTGAACTLTAIGYDRAGALVGLTNAHCFYDTEGNQFPGDEVYADLSTPGTSLAPNQAIRPDLATGPIGTVEHISGGNPVSPGPNGVGLDYSVIRLDPAKVTPTATVGEVTIRRIGAPPGFGTIVCKQGRTTGITCGMQLFRQDPYFFHTIFELPGDSGSPVVVGDTLIGNQWVAGGSTSMTAIVADLDARGGLGAGFTPYVP